MSVASFNNLAVLLELMQATRNLAKDMTTNAAIWHGWATAGTPYTQPEIAKFMTDAGASYRNIIAQATAFVTANNAAATGAVGLIGATLADLSSYTSGLSAVANGLQTVDLSTFAKIITACGQITAAVAAPPTLWNG